MARTKFNPAQVLGKTDRIQAVASSSTVAVSEQSGWNYVSAASGTSASVAITFPTAFTTLVGLEFGMLGFKSSTAPTVLTDFNTVIGGETLGLSATAVSATGFTLNAYKTSAYSSATNFYGIWWRAKGVY